MRVGKKEGKKDRQHDSTAYIAKILIPTLHPHPHPHHPHPPSLIPPSPIPLSSHPPSPHPHPISPHAHPHPLILFLTVFGGEWEEAGEERLSRVPSDPGP